ncbi:gliding motility-associated C-terminal domain-containing protein [Larkinella terrae]|uniref:T9SS type B sorting domain-containing protein n=1 Tax=Larkinella terrae TaxID=2025311 RepID=A0A7K0EPX9_9BACT|nr:gliding motility-associated C-terminal domain-containing protein [Larkinella terrae]MRS63864.1 T9SS type B sorting domain-containing protein [Larkinella terrae]
MGRAKVEYFFGISCVVFFSLLSFSGFAQDQCTPSPGQFTGALQINIGVGCLPLKVKATSGLTNVKNVRYVFDYHGGAVKDSELVSDSVFTYTKPGLFRVLQYSEQDGRQLRACAIVQVYDTLQPQVVLEPCLTRLILKIPKAAEYQYDWYTVEWGDGTREQLDGKTPIGVHTYPDDSQRIIFVKGVHLYGNCGGTTQVMFRPDTKAIPPVIDNVQPAGATTLALSISNPNGNRYWVEQRSANGAYVRTNQRSDAVSATINIEADTSKSACFRLVLADSCLLATPSAEVCYTPPKPPDPLPVPDSTVFLPEAFSPNADGINDRFQLKGLLSGTARLTVFNRWGEVVFQTEDTITGWDGKQRDQNLPPGTYSYVLDLEKRTGERSQKRGAVILMK